MIDWLIVWGVTQAAGRVVYPLLEGIAKDAAKDYSKDFFKDCLKKAIRLPEPDVLKEAYGKALKEFLELIVEELQGAGYKEAIIKQYIPYLQKFVKHEEVSAALGMAFNVECKEIDTALLVRVWTELNSPLLPEDVNWDFLSKSYIRAVKKIVQNSDKLRPIFEVQTLDKIADATSDDSPMPTVTIHRHKATNQFYDEKLDDKIHLRMMQIPAGIFQMGSPESEEGRFESERPQHRVSVPSFFMAKYPVTQAQWRIVSKMPQVQLKLNPNPSKFKGDTRPVEQVSWHEAIEFCARLTKHTKRQYRLPTEAEWEYACRAGTTTPFHFGETISPELANYNSKQVYGDGVTGEYRGETTPVDHFKIANAWGLCDMHGNVLEWCQDHRHSYYGAFADVSAWVTDNLNAPRIRRGGSWIIDPWRCRSAYRHDYNPDGRGYYLGFRVSCSAPATLQPPTDQS